MGVFSNQNVIEKFHAIRTTAAILGVPIPILFGQNRLAGRLIWYNDFTANKAKQQGGKGIGNKGSGYVYTASVIAALCHGPVTNLCSVWDGQDKYVVQQQSEQYTVPTGGGTYTPQFASAFAADQGPSKVTAYSYPVNDYGSSGAQTLSGNYNVPMTPVTGTPGTGQYNINPGTGVYTFSSGDAGVTINVNYSFYRYILATEELSIVPFSPGPYKVTVQNSTTYKQDIGVNYFPGGNALTKVSGGPAQGQYSQSGGTYTFNSADAGQGIIINYEFNNPNTDANAPHNINLTLIGGTQGQSPWSYLTTKHPSQALGYTQLAAIASSQLYLGSSPEMPNYNYELAGPHQFGGGIVDANPADCIYAILTDPGYGIGFPSASIGSLVLARACWTANNFFISPRLENQDSAASVIGQWLEAGQVACFWSEGLMKFVPYCDTSAVASGVLYQPSTTPVANLTDFNYVLDGDKANDPLEVSDSEYLDAWNRVQISYSNRVNDYNPEICAEEDLGSVQTYGLRKEQPVQYDFITTLTAAQYAASLRLQRNVYIRHTHKFQLPSSFSYLEPMDVVTLTDPTLGMNALPVRIQEIEDDPEKGLTITAEDFIYGAAAPAYNPKAINTPPPPVPSQQDPGNTTALIFEAPSRLGLQAGNLLYGFASGSNENWGGCHVWISFDGNNYQLLRDQNGNIVTVNGPARLGTLAAALPAFAGANPDSTDTLNVVMVDDTPLASTTAAGAAANVTLSAIISSGPTLELLSYQAASLTGVDQYSLTSLYRGIYGTAAGAHVAGDIYCRLDQSSFQFQYDPTYVGKTIYVKFTSFNLLGGNEQSLPNVTAYSLTIAGSGRGAIALDTGFLTTGAPGYSAYRPLSNPLTAVDAGSSATVNVAAFTMQLAGHANINYNTGAITGLNYNTLYYIYLDDPSLVGGTPSGGYQDTLAKENAFAGITRFFVGSIVTPPSGGASTIGNNDGGVSSQNGMLSMFLFTQATQFLQVGSGALTNPLNALDLDTGAFAGLTATAGSASAVTLQLANASVVQRRFSSYTLKVLWSVPTNTLNGSGPNGAFGLYFGYNGVMQSSPFGNIFAGGGITQPTITLSTALFTATQNISQIVVRAQLDTSGATSGSIAARIYGAWIEGVE
jgi:hypothetical protein